MGAEGPITTSLSATLTPLPSQRGRKESPFSFLLLFFNPKDLFDFLQNYGQENNFLHFFFFFPELSHLEMSQAPAVSKPAEFHVTHVYFHVPEGPVSGRPALQRGL